MIGLNSTMPPGLMPPGLPGLPGQFPALNGMALSQNQGSGYTPALQQPVQMNVPAPDAGAALDALNQQMEPSPTAAPRTAQGIQPNSTTPPAQTSGPNAGGGQGTAPAPGAPMSFSDMLNHFAQLSANGGGLGGMGQNIANNFGASPLGQFFAGLGRPQTPNPGQMPAPPPNPGVLGINVGPSVAAGQPGVLGF